MVVTAALETETSNNKTSSNKSCIYKNWWPVHGPEFANICSGVKPKPSERSRKVPRGREGGGEGAVGLRGPASPPGCGHHRGLNTRSAWPLPRGTRQATGSRTRPPWVCAGREATSGGAGRGRGPSGASAGERAGGGAWGRFTRA